MRVTKAANRHVNQAISFTRSAILPPPYHAPWHRGTALFPYLGQKDASIQKGVGALDSTQANPQRSRQARKVPGRMQQWRKGVKARRAEGYSRWVWKSALATFR